MCFDVVPVGRSLPQNGPDPRWYLQEEYTSLSKIPRCISFVIRKCSQSSNEVVGKVILSHPDQLEWLQNMTSKPVINYQERTFKPKLTSHFFENFSDSQMVKI